MFFLFIYSYKIVLAVLRMCHKYSIM